jgi:ribosomal protein S10
MIDMVSNREHQLHRAEAMEVFRQQHGDADEWTPYECECHDRMLEAINQEDGYEQENGK